ncbi:hypothetical protein FDT66_05555 [Polaribacter aestuariivivens]|uniref:Uncharacterized protein n=1 Tax=Polaribacter aestuariivivens TaxID=2304626 RepID=A0A5S3N7Y4_9FLAO|nr:hypothetical protein [Polaribacter aestuariivivens]TMM31431.1 hypothetical protein FDT66_05555 [Polaribacter aestuariivivens]
MKSFSIEKSKKTVLSPNSEFERRVIFQYYLDNDISINEFEREILNNCTVSEPESIGIIGCLLNDSSHLNTLRLAIGAKNKSNKKLAKNAASSFTSEALEKANNYYSFEKDFDLFTKIEQIVSREYDMLYY